MNPDAIATAIRERHPTIGPQDAAALAQLLAALLAEPSATHNNPDIGAALRPLVGQTRVTAEERDGRLVVTLGVSIG